MYFFSAPMPYTKEDIQKLLDINSQVEKSKITSLYMCLPYTCNLFTGFEQARNDAAEYSDWEYWQKLIEYTLSKNCDFIYLLNSPNPFNMGNEEKLNKLDKLLIELNKLGIKKLRIASPQLITYVSKYYKNFTIYASTSLEYKTRTIETGENIRERLIKKQS